jgi:predicted hydrocarbon binding protein
MCKGVESWRGLERDWNAVETKCIGLGDPYCEFKLVPGEIDRLRNSLNKDVSVLESIHKRLMDRLMGFLLDGNPLIERPKLGSEISTVGAKIFSVPLMGGERVQMAWRMGGAKFGREVGERLMETGIDEEEGVKRVLDFLEYCKVGKIEANTKIRIVENCECLWTNIFLEKWGEPSCFFTTGFLNGIFTAIKNQHVRETKCLAQGDPYCEWELG